MNFNKIIVSIVFLAAIGILCLTSCKDKEVDRPHLDTSLIAVSGEMTAELTAPPHVPPSVGNRVAKKLIVDMEILEQDGRDDRWSHLYILDFWWFCSR